jgi:hypothetical protein
VEHGRRSPVSLPSVLLYCDYCELERKCGTVAEQGRSAPREEQQGTA